MAGRDKGSKQTQTGAKVASDGKGEGMDSKETKLELSMERDGASEVRKIAYLEHQRTKIILTTEY